MIQKIISGGQTGVDQAALRVARELGVQTGGFVPRGYLTEAGPMPDVLMAFGLIEMRTRSFAARTIANVKAADGTLWIGSADSRGYVCTSNAAKKFGKAFLIIDRQSKLETGFAERLFAWAYRCNIHVLNVAGHRASIDPKAAGVAEDLLRRAAAIGLFEERTER